MQHFKQNAAHKMLVVKHLKSVCIESHLCIPTCTLHFFPAYLKSEVEHLKKEILNMQENQDEILRSLKSLERSLPRLVPIMTVVTTPAIEMNNLLNATNPQETATPPHSSPSPSATPQPASPTPSSTLLPITIASRSNSLPSSFIDRSGLCTIEEVLLKYPKLKVEGKMGKLTCRLAQEAVFGTEIMKRCTPYGTLKKKGCQF